MTFRTLKYALPAMAALVFLAAPAGAGVLLDRVVAVVNKEAITWSELYRAMEFELSKRVKKLSDEQKREIFKQNEGRFLEDMVDLRLQLQEAEKLGVTVDEEQVDAAIENIRGKYSMGEKEFYSALVEEGFSREKYRETIRDQITIGRLVEREVRGKIVLSDKETRRLLKKENISEGVYYGLSQILLVIPDGGNVEAVQKKAEEIVGRLRAGEDFGLLAREYSEGPAAQAGGEIGLVPKSHLAPQFLKALEDLAPGDVSSPFRTAQGIHILKLTARRDAAEILKERLFEKRYRQWLRGLRDKAFIEIRLEEGA